jgi:HEPN domain-containing protein
MSGHDLPRDLLNAAKSDLKALSHMLDPDVFDDRVFGFHAQQAVEKALKVWLNCLQGRHPFTHDLSLLLHTLEEQGADVEFCWDFLDLSSYAVQFRYETMPEGEEPLDRHTLVKDIQALVAHVEKMIPQA